MHFLSIFVPFFMDGVLINSRSEQFSCIQDFQMLLFFLNVTCIVSVSIFLIIKIFKVCLPIHLCENIAANPCVACFIMHIKENGHVYLFTFLFLALLNPEDNVACLRCVVKCI